MAIVYNSSNGSGGSLSSDCTATRQNVMENATAITRDSNDVAISGLLPLAAVLLANGGTLQINSITAFSVSQSNTTPNTVIFSIPVTAQSGRPWGGVYIRCKLGSYPTDRTDGTECGYFSQNGSTFTFPEATDEQTWYFRAWDFYRYNQRGDSTYDSICWGSSHNAICVVKRRPTRYTVIIPGDITQNVSGNMNVPIGYTHMDVAVIACGGWSGVSLYDTVSSGLSGNQTSAGTSGGEGGEVKILSLSCSYGQPISWNIGKAGTKPIGTLRNYSDSHWAWTEPYSQGTAGQDTTFTFDGTTHTAQAGNNGTSGGNFDSKPGGTGRPGADGGYANNAQEGIGGNGVDGTYFIPTATLYGGGGCGVGRTYRSWDASHDYNYYGQQGHKGLTDGAYGHGGNAAVGNASNAQSGQPGAIIISFT